MSPTPVMITDKEDSSPAAPARFKALQGELKKLSLSVQHLNKKVTHTNGRQEASKLVFQGCVSALTQWLEVVEARAGVDGDSASAGAVMSHTGDIWSVMEICVSSES